MNPWVTGNGQQQQYISREQFKLIQAQQQQQFQQQQQQLLKQQQQQENQQIQQSLQQQRQINDTPSALEAAIAMMAEDQKNLADSMSCLLTKLDNSPLRWSPEVPLVDQEPT